MFFFPIIKDILAGFFGVKIGQKQKPESTRENEKPSGVNRALIRRVYAGRGSSSNPGGGRKWMKYREKERQTDRQEYGKKKNGNFRKM